MYVYAFQEVSQHVPGNTKETPKILLRAVILLMVLHFMALSIVNNVQHQQQINEIWVWKTGTMILTRGKTTYSKNYLSHGMAQYLFCGLPIVLKLLFFMYQQFSNLYCSSPSCGSYIQPTMKMEYLLRNQVFWAVTLFFCTRVSQCFRGTQYLHCQRLRGPRILAV